MITKTTYKKQGDGRDSWIVEFNDRAPEIVYQDPTTPTNQDASNLDFTTLTARQILELKDILGL